MTIRDAAPPVAALLAFLTALSTWVLNDGDTWWHVAAGRMMIAHRAVLHTDPFSYTFAGAPWRTHEWLAQILFGEAFNLAGWSGVIVLTAIAFGLTAWLLSRALRTWVSGLPYLCLLGFGLLLGTPSLLARPHLLALPILTVWTASLINARAEERAPRWALLPLMALWANLHGSFMFGLALIGPFALEALLAAPPDCRRDVVLRWGAFGLAAAAMPLISPDGVETLLFPVQLLRMASLAHIGEWAPADFSIITPFEIGLLATLVVIFTRKIRLSAIRIGLLLLLLHLSLQHMRYQEILGVIGVLILARPFALGFGQNEAAGITQRRSIWVLGCGALALAVAIGAVRLAVPVVRVDDVRDPVAAVAATPAALRHRPVLNDYAFGGYLIGQGISPFVDSRADLYGDAFLNAYLRMMAPDHVGLAQTLDQRRIAWTLFTPGSAAAVAMDAMPGWRRLYADRWAVIHVRR
jgi:hypothetical protein